MLGRSFIAPRQYLTGSEGREFLLEPWSDASDQRMGQISAEFQGQRRKHVTVHLGEARGSSFFQAWLVEAWMT